MIIKTATFVVSNSKVSACLKHTAPEYAFIGRSNVGKSSLINMLTNQKYLAKTSSTPGKTQLINHFLINDKWYLVDLPGFGYAKTAKSNRVKWENVIADYFKNREELTSAFVLIDSRLEPQKIDLEFMEWLGENRIPFAMIFTKIDKLSSTALHKNMIHYQKTMLKTWEELPPIFRTSATTGFGKEEVLNYIDAVSSSLK